MAPFICPVNVAGFFDSSVVAGAGNLVEIEDGCATVKGYKLPQPLACLQAGKAGARSETRSQDISTAALVRPQKGHFSDKGRMRPVR